MGRIAELMDLERIKFNIIFTKFRISVFIFLIVGIRTRISGHYKKIRTLKLSMEIY